MVFIGGDLHTGSVEGHQCVQCGRSYKNKGDLSKHIKFDCGKEPGFHAHTVLRK